jgi:hypothetical protein
VIDELAEVHEPGRYLAAAAPPLVIALATAARFGGNSSMLMNRSVNGTAMLCQSHDALSQ